MSQGLNGVRQAAKDRKQERFTALLHHLSIGLLRDSFFALKRQASPGVDGVTWQEYEAGLEDRLVDLHDRVHRGAYRAQPSRRVYIPKADGRQRPLGIAALEDKIVQQAVVTILNQIYEVDFKGFSYGFRPGRSPHQALDALSVGLYRKRVNWVLDADIRGFFDNMSHAVPGNSPQLRIFWRRVCRLWRSVLVRRSQCAQVHWGRLFPLLHRWIPQPLAILFYKTIRCGLLHQSEAEGTSRIKRGTGLALVSYTVDQSGIAIDTHGFHELLEQVIHEYAANSGDLNLQPRDRPFGAR
jgi:hypothetical protein